MLKIDFDLARVAGAANENQLFGVIHNNEDLGIGAVDFRDRFEIGDVDDRERRIVRFQFSRVFDLDEHVARKQTVPGVLGDDADMQLMVGVEAPAQQS